MEDNSGYVHSRLQIDYALLCIYQRRLIAKAGFRTFWSLGPRQFARGQQTTAAVQRSVLAALWSASADNVTE